MKWYQKAEDELCQELDDGEITAAEFNQYMRELMQEVRDEAEDAADNARDDYYS